MKSPKCTLVVGGTGYIGSHMVWLLGQKSVDVVTLDNLSSGHRDAVSHGQFVQGDIADRLILDKVFRKHNFDAVMHFASFIQVGESVQDSTKYYQNNVVNTLIYSITTKIKQELGWQPIYAELNTIVEHVWHWETLGFQHGRIGFNINALCH